MDIESIVQTIGQPDEKSKSLARKRQDMLTKPRGSLGRLEELSIQLAGIYGTEKPEIGRKAIYTMAADHGVTAEGVSAYPSDVTAQMVLNFANQGAAINVLGAFAGAEVITVDMGVRANCTWPESIVSCAIRSGTGNFARELAMTREEATQAVLKGAELCNDIIDRGVNLVGIGDMGIGNTTSASAITAVFTELPVSDVTGHGTGIDDYHLEKKIATIEAALDFHSPNPSDPIGVLSKVGGLEIAGMTGVIIAAASRDIPIVLDGFISGSSALIAAALAPASREYMIAAHQSVERGHESILRALELEPVLDLRMRLGEGTGAALAMMILEAACKILTEMATFEETGISNKTE